jgi:UDP-N-acetylmuramoylalanine--D-glutamate ligase
MTRLDELVAARREVAVAGLVRSGRAATRLLASRGLRVYASDSSADMAQAAAELERDFADFVSAEAGIHDLARIERAAALVVSPGIPPTAPPVAAAAAAGVPIIAEAQLGLDALDDVPWVAVTGTNGKTTTTAMVAHLLAGAGRRVTACGNIGTPVSAAAMESPRPEWLAVELSSYQLHDMSALKPVVGILTNLSADHLDRYPAIEDYYADKARFFGSADQESIWVTNLDDPDSRDMRSGVPGRHLSFTIANGIRADAWFDRIGDALMLGDDVLLERSRLQLPGDHNVANALAAALAVRVTGVSLEVLAGALASFAPMEHRLEPVGVVDGVSYINDSKATTVASTEVAMAAMDRPFVLLLGGIHKGAPYTPLLAHVKPHCVAVVAYGEAAPVAAADLASGVAVHRAGNLDEAVGIARGIAPGGGAVLLSPACSSFDQFPNYGARGMRFRELVRAM